MRTERSTLGVKKILALIVMSILLTSCFGKTEETVVNDDTGTVVEDTTNNDSNTDDSIPTEDDSNTDSTPETNVEDTTTSDDTKTDPTPETNSADEEILEDEVNALLDEFIDSLDNYDK